MNLYAYVKEKLSIGGKIVIGFGQRAWTWLLEKPERLTSLSTLAIFITTAVAAFIALAQWRALILADKTTRESFSAVQRPFIIATGLNVSEQTYGANSPQYWDIQMALENSGNTPTKNMTVTSSVSFSVPVVKDSPRDPADMSQNDKPRPIRTDYFVGPHSKINIDALSLHFKTAEEMAQSRSDFFVYGIARYRDQFSDTPERLTKFCFVVRPYLNKNNGTVQIANYSLCHHWNCGDEDCKRDKQNYESDLRAALNRNPQAVEIKRDVPIATILPYFPEPMMKAY